MSSMKQVGTIYQDGREGDVYLVMELDGEVYFFRRATYYQGLTRWADKGCHLKDIEKKMEELEERERAHVIDVPMDDKDPELGFV